MKKVLMTAIMTSISEVMETMFFLPVEFDRESVLAGCGMDQENNMACQLTFTGDASGHLILIAPRSLVSEMAENFMGESREHLTEAHLSGTLTEMLNMICGNALSKIGSTVPYEVGIPEMIDAEKIPGKDIFSIVETTGSKMAVLLKMN